MCLLFYCDCAIRALNAKWFFHRFDCRLLVLGQLVVADEMVRSAAVEHEGPIRGVHGLRESRIVYCEELDVHIIKISLKSVPRLTRHAPSFLPCCPFSELDVLQMVRILGIRRFVARPGGAFSLWFSFGCSSVYRLQPFITVAGDLQVIRSKLDFPARVAPCNQGARFGFYVISARVAPRINSVLRMA